MGNIITTLEPTYQDQIMKHVYEIAEHWSELTLITEFKSKEFEALCDELFKTNHTITKHDMFLSKKTQKLFSFYHNVTRICDDLVITYNTVQRQTKNEVYDDNGDELLIEDMTIDETKDSIVSDVIIYYHNSDKTKNFIDVFVEKLNDIFYERSNTGAFYTIGMNSYGFDLEMHDALEVKSDIEIHYGKAFMPVHEEILNNLTNKHSGLMLFHGTPGTGKTSYIRFLISELSKHKKIIYVPAFMIEQIANPEFVTFIQKHKESILVLEDAEFALQSRSSEFGAQAVSNLLNITSGLLNDATKIQVIATFNMDKKKLDEALLRPGRLLNEWKFDKLSVEDSKALAEYLGKDMNITIPMTVAEIYEGKVQNKKTKTKIGF